MASGKTLYIKGDRDVEVTKPDVTLEIGRAHV